MQAIKAWLNNTHLSTQTALVTPVQASFLQSLFDSLKRLIGVITGSPQDITFLLQKVKNNPDGANLKRLEQSVKCAWHRMGLNPNDKQVAMSVKGLLKTSLCGRPLADLCKKIDADNHITFLDNHARKLSATTALILLTAAGSYFSHNITHLLKKSIQINDRSQRNLSDGSKLVFSIVIGLLGVTSFLELKPVFPHSPDLDLKDAWLTRDWGSKEAEELLVSPITTSLNVSRASEMLSPLSQSELEEKDVLEWAENSAAYLQLPAGLQCDRFSKLSRIYQRELFPRLAFKIQRILLCYSPSLPKTDKQFWWSCLSNKAKADWFNVSKDSDLLKLLSYLNDEKDFLAFFPLVNSGKQQEIVVKMIKWGENAKWIFNKMSRKDQIGALSKILPNKRAEQPWWKLYLLMEKNPSIHKKDVAVPLPQNVVCREKFFQEGLLEDGQRLIGESKVLLKDDNIVILELPIDRNYDGVSQVIESLPPHIEITNIGYSKGLKCPVNFLLDPKYSFPSGDCLLKTSRRY